MVPENGQNRGRLRPKRVWMSARGDGELGSLCEEVLAAKIHLFRYRTVLRDPTGNSIVTILARAQFYSDRVSTFPSPTFLHPQLKKGDDGHRCHLDGAYHIGIGGPEGYKRILDHYTNNEFGSYGRAMVFCPLHRSLPYVVVFLAVTCNRFTATGYVEPQWKAVSAICDDVLGGVVGPVVGHASDGDGRRRHLMKESGMVKKELRSQPQKQQGCFYPAKCAGYAFAGKMVYDEDQVAGEADDASRDWRPVLETTRQEFTTTCDDCHVDCSSLSWWDEGSNGDYCPSCHLKTGMGDVQQEDGLTVERDVGSSSDDGEGTSSGDGGHRSGSWIRNTPVALKEPVVSSHSASRLPSPNTAPITGVPTPKAGVKDIHHQDPIHVAKRLKNNMDSLTRTLTFGDSAVATMAQLDSLRVWGEANGIDHGLVVKDTQQKDRQNWASCQAI